MLNLLFRGVWEGPYSNCPQCQSLYFWRSCQMLSFPLLDLQLRVSLFRRRCQVWQPDASHFSDFMCAYIWVWSCWVGYRRHWDFVILIWLNCPNQWCYRFRVPRYCWVWSEQNEVVYYVNNWCFIVGESAAFSPCPCSLLVFNKVFYY